MSPPGRSPPPSPVACPPGGWTAGGSRPRLAVDRACLPTRAAARGSRSVVGRGPRASCSAPSATKFLNDANGDGRALASSTAARSDG
eukprot:4025207-Pleurochrysis_carterae.AAC.1